MKKLKLKMIAILLLMVLLFTGLAACTQPNQYATLLIKNGNSIQRVTVNCKDFITSPTLYDVMKSTQYQSLKADIVDGEMPYLNGIGGVSANSEIGEYIALYSSLEDFRYGETTLQIEGKDYYYASKGIGELPLRENATYVFNLQNWMVESLDSAKATAIQELSGYVLESNYREAEKVSLRQAIASGTQAISAATTEVGVASALAEAKTAIDGISTDAELTENELNKPILSFTLSVEAFTLGAGYLVEPTKVMINGAILKDMATIFGLPSKEVMREKLNGAYILAYLLTQNGLGYDHSGTLDSAFYLQKIKNLSYQLKIPQNLQDVVVENGGSIESMPATEGELGEFDYTSMSGWMYEINGEFLGYGFSDYIPQDGDLIRVQFTLFGFGADIGGGWGNNFFDVVNRCAVTQLIAEAIVLKKNHTDIFNIAYQTVQKMGVTQTELDTAYQNLHREMYGV